MAKLSPQELEDRLRTDFRTAMDMRCEVMTVTAFASEAAARARRGPILAVEEAGRARFYYADYRIRTLVERGLYHERTEVFIDLLLGGNYPYSEPGTMVLSRPLPWSPHFREGYPICTGELWKDARGNITVGHLLIHIAKLLNFDEVSRGSGYEGWNGDAQRYWLSELKGRPITPDLRYPVLPVWLSGTTHSANAFRPRATSTSAAPPPTIFRGKGQIAKVRRG